MREYAPPDVANYFWNEVQLAMQQEKAAIIMEATNFGPRLEDPAQSKISGKVGFAQLPQKLGPDGKGLGPAQTKGRFGDSDATYALSVPRTSKQKEAAWLFTQWAASPDVMLQTTQLGLRADPTRRSSLDRPKFAEKYNFGSGDASFAKTLAGAFELAMPNYYPRLVTGSQLGARGVTRPAVGEDGRRCSPETCPRREWLRLPAAAPGGHATWDTSAN